MKKQSFISSAVMTITAIFIMAATNFVFAAGVSSLVTQGTIQNELGEDISVVGVNCSNSQSESRIITSKSGERDWCSKDIPDICSRTKVGVAAKVCRFSFSNQVKEYQDQLANTSTDVVSPAPERVPSDSATPSAEEQAAVGKLQLEKERISIEQQKLQIRRQELELNKRQLELERQAVTVD